METISEGQKETLIKFRERIKDVIRSGHDDNVLYKWLKARNFNLKKAEAMYRKSMSWRDECGADTIVKTFKEPEIMKKYYPGGLCGRDKEGRPLWLDPLGGADLRGIMYSVKKSDILKTFVFRLEMLHAAFKQRTEEDGRLIHQCVHIIDMQGFGSNFMWKPALDMYVEVLHLLEDNYPETLYKTYFINAPKIFQVGYNVIKQFIDKDTAKKLKFLDSGWKKTIASLMDMDTLPVHYGGTFTDPDGDPKCSSKVCYGGQVPKEFYRKKEEFFPSTPKPETIGRGSSITLAYRVPDSRHVLRFIFTVDSSEIEFGAYLDPNPPDASSEPNTEVRLKRVDVSGMEVIHSPSKYQCHRVPEDGMLFFEKPGTCYLQFRNPSKFSKRDLAYLIGVEQLDGNDAILDGATGVISTTTEKDDTFL